MEKESEGYWQREWGKAEKKLAKARFVHGWLISCLEDAGLTAVEAGQKYLEAQTEANRIYGE